MNNFFLSYNTIGKILATEKLPLYKKFVLKSKENIHKKSKKFNLYINISDIENIKKTDRLKGIFIELHEKVFIDEKIDFIKSLNQEISVVIKNISEMTAEAAVNLNKTLKMKYIIINDENQEYDGYNIISYIYIRECIDKILADVKGNVSQEEKFLNVYKLILQNIKYTDKVAEEGDRNYCDTLNGGIIDRESSSKGIAITLKNLLSEFGIECNIIKGKVKDFDKEFYFNQVNLNNEWYNTDIALDIIVIKDFMRDNNISKMKNAYKKFDFPNCAKSDKEFFETHIFTNTNKEICYKSINARAIRRFFKVGKYTENSLIVSFIGKVKNKFGSKNTKFLLPESNKTYRYKKVKDMTEEDFKEADVSFSEIIESTQKVVPTMIVIPKEIKKVATINFKKLVNDNDWRA